MISYCIACKNRLHHLKKTLPRTFSNLLDQDEIILLDYDSEDDLDQWLSKNRQLFDHRLRYFKLLEGKQRWRKARAKNVAHRLASKSIVCNLDADNWIPGGFSSYVLRALKPEKIILVTNLEKSYDGAGGRVALYRSDFQRLRGYDERMESWGYDVADFCRRAKLLGWRTRRIPDSYIHFIRHSNKERVFYHGCKRRRESSLYNKRFSDHSVKTGNLTPNDKDWGKAKVKEIKP